MSGPVIHTSADVVFELSRLVQAMTRVVDELATADEEAVKARLGFDLRFAKAFISAEGSIDLRRHQATIDTYEHRLAAELADVRVRNLRRKVESLRIQVDTARSMGAAVRTEAQAFGTISAGVR